MSTTSRGQVPVLKEIFQHVEIKRGEKLEIGLMPESEIRDRAVRKKGKLEEVFGTLAGKTDVKLTIEEMDEAIGEAVVEEFLRGVQR